ATEPGEIPGNDDILNLLTKPATQNLRSACTRRTYKRHRKTLIHRHRYQGSLTETRQSFNPNAFCVDKAISFQVINYATRTPRPGAYYTPIVRVALLTLRGQSYDSLIQTAIIRLNRPGVQ